MLKSSEAPTVSRASGKHGLQLLISSRDASALNHLKTVSQRLPSLQVTTRLVSNGHTDPLYGLERMPDFLLLRVSHLWREELAALLQRPAHERPPLLVCGPLEEREGIRLAMQAGARDFLPEPVAADELLAALGRMLQETQAGQATGGKLIAVMNAKGGSGATLLACNLAHQLSARGGSTLLLDLDLQFGSVAHCLDVVPAHSHMEVLQQIEEMDSVALRGYCSHFSPTLHVLGGRSGELYLPQDVHLEQLEALLRLARSTYDWVVVDLPRQIDHLTGITLEQADRVYILVQQSLSHLKDATRLVRIMRDELGVQGNRLQVVV
ncbi:AAA family ATPase, partial [Pseudomonas sp. CrR25]|nr:AAA family ATPase [Pseudomonas sp. CrR25]